MAIEAPNLENNLSKIKKKEKIAALKLQLDFHKSKNMQTKVFFILQKASSYLLSILQIIFAN